MAARMMSEERMKGSIDQIDQLIHFENGVCKVFLFEAQFWA